MCVCICDLSICVCICACLSICAYLSADCVCLSVCVYCLSVYLSICMRLSIASICICLPLLLCLSGPVCLSVGLPVYRLVGNHSVCLSEACLSVASLGQSVCVRVCDYAAKPFCAASYFLGAAPSKSPVKQHSDTGQSFSQCRSGVCRYLSIVCRGLTFQDRFGSLLAQWTRESDHNP